MVPTIARTSALVQDIVQTSDQQSDAVSQISAAASQLAQVIQQNSLSSEELAVTSEEQPACHPLQTTVGFSNASRGPAWRRCKATALAL
jgi:methyl-accepting chemotaxis protein